MEATLQRVEAALGELGRILQSPKRDALRCDRADVQLPPVAQRILHRAAAEGASRISDLARATQTGDAAVSRQVTLLEERGLARREPDPEDGRASLVRVTAEGRRVRRRLRQAQDEIFRERLGGWSGRDLVQLAALLERLPHALRD